MKFGYVINEKENELDLTNSDHVGLLGWVKDYIKMRHYTPFKKDVIAIKKKIDKEIKRLKLNRKDVFFYYGDIDDPKQKKEVLRKIGVEE